MKITSLTSTLAHIRMLLPHRCLLCHQQTEHYQQQLCNTCRDDLPFPEFLCLGCANEIHQHMMFCGQCQIAPPPHLLITACHYLSPIKELISSLKYRKNQIAARELARHLALRVTDCVERQQIELPQLLIPVPLHFTRQLSRGFNQAQLIADHLGELLGIPVGNYCRRIKPTPAQAQLNAQQRSHNLDGVFQLSQSFEQSSVALIDDVFTTGSTMLELTRTINQQHNVDIQYWCISRTLI
ncbi:MAG: ComF family protein [Gammaproteobacteria bacterium]|nr:ComF family protein [Gammaproteobacteria bacterium]